MPMDLAAAIDRPLVPADRSSERYLMLGLGAPDSATRRLPLNLALVIDTSGSMHGAKLSRVKEAASFVIRQLSSADRVALVTYDDGANVIAPSTLLTPTARTDLRYRISRIEAGGWTNLGSGWLTGCQLVAEGQRLDEQLDRVLLLSDGLVNVGITDPDELTRHAGELRRRNIVTSTMGVGADFNEGLLESLARHGGGRFQFVESAKHIPDCVQGEIGELLSVRARKVAVEITLPTGVQVAECLNDFRTELTTTGRRIHLDDLIAGEVRRVLLRLAVDPPDTLDDAASAVGRDIRALALYVDVDTGRGVELAFPIASLQYADLESVENQTIDRAVEEELALQVAARARHEAVRLTVLGDRQAAAVALASSSQLLAGFATANRPTVAGEIAALASLAENAQEGFGRQELKELHYQSYLQRQQRRRYDRPEIT